MLSGINEGVSYTVFFHGKEQLIIVISLLLLPALSFWDTWTFFLKIVVIS